MTGGAGFIGSNFVRHLLRTNPDCEVVNFDLLTYAGNLSSLSEIEADPRYRFIHGDICDAEAVTEALAGVDMVFNLAAESHVDRSIVSDSPFVLTNVVGTAVLLSAALDVGVRRFVQVSTDEVYGTLPWKDPEAAEEDDRPFTEETPLAPRSPYAASKAAADHLTIAYHITHGLDVIITRCSNNYGPFQHVEKLIPLMITRARADQRLPLYGDGLHVREWLHVEDHCRGLLAAAEHGTPGRVYNFSAGTERTNLSIVRELLAILEKPESLIEHVTDRPGHDRRYAVDSTRAREELDWLPRFDFADGLGSTVQWYLEHDDWLETSLKAR